MLPRWFDGKHVFFATIAGALFVIAYFPAFQILVEKWSNSEEYSHAFLMIPIIVYMVWKKKEILQQGQKQYTFIGLIVVVFAMVLYYFALLTQVHTIISLSMLLTVVGACVYLYGSKAVIILITPLLLFLLLIPVPDSLYIKLTFPLQLKVSQMSEVIVGMFGIPIFRQGNVMTIPNKSFEVVEACSGLRSMITLANLSIVIGYFMLERKTSKCILFLSSIPIAVFVNVVRVSMMILLYHFFKLDLVEGLLHIVSGVAVFVLALISLLAFNKILEIWENK